MDEKKKHLLEVFENKIDLEYEIKVYNRGRVANV